MPPACFCSQLGPFSSLLAALFVALPFETRIGESGVLARWVFGFAEKGYRARDARYVADTFFLLGMVHVGANYLGN